jgi:hypothetical protein
MDVRCLAYQLAKGMWSWTQFHRRTKILVKTVLYLFLKLRGDSLSFLNPNGTFLARTRDLNMEYVSRFLKILKEDLRRLIRLTRSLRLITYLMFQFKYFLYFEDSVSLTFACAGLVIWNSIP